ncbi:MAG: DUF1349 domain-containing protein [Acidobacteria bacterium]|nr:DUF1349 domain-containing protein [Acidobacteriota bacterium]
MGKIMRQTKGNHNRAAPGAMMKFRHPMLDENFDREQLDQRLEWRNPPERWWMDDATSRLMVEPRGRTDYWRKTAYGFEADNGPALVVEIGGDFVLTTRVRSYPAHQYDQAGLLIHCSPECWLKTSVEYEPGGPCQLGVVATNGGYSDWSLQDFPRDRREISLRVRLRGGDCLVEFQAEERPVSGPNSTICASSASRRDRHSSRTSEKSATVIRFEVRLMRWSQVSVIASLILWQASAAPPRISIAVYQDKVYASWLGQCVGNIYGLAHEQKYFQQPGPDNFPLGYSGWGAARMKQVNGAFSDDDTDVEYMYLLAMEKYGMEPRYADLAEFWMRSVHHDVWLANRAAVGAMRYGRIPPWTGRKEYNPHWFQIDAQLVNEIWAVTAPGMVGYAVAKSDWAARIMADGWAVEPTLFYGAMYSAAFFESDVGKLIQIGKAALPPGARFARTIDAMLGLHDKYPADWKAARMEVLRLGYLEEPAESRTGTNANINAAFAVLALLYGGGDFERTLDLACALGFDADNEAATVSGLLGLIQGSRAIPRHLLFPYPELGWKQPFNDRYKVVTREGLPDAGLRDMGRRLAAQGERVILAHGGRKAGRFYEINPAATFTPPFEFPAGPLPAIEAGWAVDHTFLAVGAGASPVWRLVEGKLPDGLRFAGGRLTGSATAPPGVYPVTVEVQAGARALRQRVPLVVRGENLARTARRILTPVEKPDLDLFRRLFLDTPPVWLGQSPEVLRDGRRSGAGATFLSIGAGTAPRSDQYGYLWAEPKAIGAVAVTTGFLEETSGWFTALGVEYQDEAGAWRPVAAAVVTPPFPSGDVPSDKAHFAEYLFRFQPVVTRGIRISGAVGMVASPKAARFTSVSELSVYRPEKR